MSAASSNTRKAKLWELRAAASLARLRRANSHAEVREFSRTNLLDPVDVKRPIDGDEIRRPILLGPCLMHHLRRHVAERAGR